MSDDLEIPRVSNTEALVLGLLADGTERFGLELVDQSSGKLKMGSIYTTLQRMSNKGLVTSRTEPRPDPEVGIPRRYFRITGLGVRIYNARLTYVRALREEFA